MWINFSQSSIPPPRLKIHGVEIERVNTFRLLGVWANKLLFLLEECRKSSLPPELGLLTYTTKIRPILEYASPVWGGIPRYLEEELESNNAA